MTNQEETDLLKYELESINKTIENMAYKLRNLHKKKRFIQEQIMKNEENEGC